MPSPVADITIAGAGPAGSALAAALGVAGARVTVVDPAPHAPWPNRYGAWASDLAAAGHGDAVEHTYDTVLADFGSGQRILSGRYVTVDRPRLRERLQAAPGVTWVTGRIMTARHDATGTTVTCADGRTHRTRVLVDATGTGTLLERPGPPTAFQVALGRLVEVDAHPWAPGTATFMDFSTAHLRGGSAVADPPTFLYALPVDDRHVFVEETSLAGDPPVSLDLLGARLDARLAHLGVEVRGVHDVEHCRIPMNTPLPRRGRVVGFGAAASWVHPATGYQLTRALGAAPVVAHALLQGLERDPVNAARAAWAAVWPAAERRTRALHDMGLSLLLTLDADQTRAFFDAFLALPPSAWRTYLDATSPPAAVALAMSRTLVHLPAALRGIVLRHALGQGRRELVRAVTPQLGGAQ